MAAGPLEEHASVYFTTDRLVNFEAGGFNASARSSRLLN
jgi:hypothetical protein